MTCMSLVPTLNLACPRLPLSSHHRYDLDGSLTGHVAGTALPFYKFNEWADGCFNDTSGAYDSGEWAPGGMVCNGSSRVRRLQMWGQEPDPLDGKGFSLKKSEVMSDGVDQWGGLNWTRYQQDGVRALCS
jgi:hypothetical protein